MTAAMHGKPPPETWQCSAVLQNPVLGFCLFVVWIKGIKDLTFVQPFK